MVAEVNDQASAHRLAAAVTAAGLAGVQDVVPGTRTVTVLADPQRCDMADLAVTLRTRELAPRDLPDPRTHQIPVVYDGEDLTDVATMCQLSVEEVVRRHCGATYTVALVGFSPGFAYLTGLDPALTVSRRATPRTAVPPGSVALAEDHTAIYPQATPGGWQVIGRTNTVLFDPHGDPPALLRPADRVRLVAS